MTTEFVIFRDHFERQWQGKSSQWTDTKVTTHFLWKKCLSGTVCGFSGSGKWPGQLVSVLGEKSGILAIRPRVEVCEFLWRQSTVYEDLCLTC